MMRPQAAFIVSLTLLGAAAPERVELAVPAAPSAVASLLTYWERPAEPGNLEGFDSHPGRDGRLPASLLLAAQDRGLHARSFQASVKEVKRELTLGRPVLAYLKLSPFDVASRGRFVLVTGFDDGRGAFSVRSVGAESTFVPYVRFMRRWEKTGRWAILVLPSGV